MIDNWVVFGAAFLYILFLFLVAYIGDKKSIISQGKGRPIVYALSLAVYCTSWTFFGSVGLSASTGYDFIPVYIGAILMVVFGQPLLQHIIKLSKTQNITSIADFIAARYGKNQTLAAIITVIAVIGTLPYIALQLQAVSDSVSTLLGPAANQELTEERARNIAFFVAMLMALFSILFGTRQIGATEHQQGLITAIAAESIIKLCAFLIVGIYVTFFMFNGPFALFEQGIQNQKIRELFTKSFDGNTWFTITFLSMVAIILLPRQFHVAVVENNSKTELRTAGWLFPLYLIIINIFVIPITIAGLLTFPEGTVKPDMFVLALPMHADEHWITLISFIGGLSAATAMVIMASIALSIMVSNDLIVPFLLHRGKPDYRDREDLSILLLNIRRAAIFLIFILSYLFYRMLSGSFPLASIGLLAFAAIAQFSPAFFGGLFWKRATSRGAIAGTTAGFFVWAYTLLLPALEPSGLIPNSLLTDGPFGLEILRPQILFYLKFDWLTHGVVLSLTTNILAYIVFSLIRAPRTIERLQASTFIGETSTLTNSPLMRFSRSNVTISELQSTAACYLGEERAKRSFAEYAQNRNQNLLPNAEADIALMRYTEYLLASAIGAASSRLVLSLLLRKENMSGKAAIRLLDDATEAIQYNRDFLQSALDQVSQGISVFDKNLRLICWNRQFRNLLDLPPELGRVGVSLDEIIRFNATKGSLGDGFVEDIVKDRIQKLAINQETFQERINDGERTLLLRTNTMPQGGIVTTYADITTRVEAVEALAQSNETLERRVEERTAELTKVNHELETAKSKADEANRDKTRFLASASHDLLQPLNAARLYSSALLEKSKDNEINNLIQNLDASLGSVEEILSALLDISRLDSGVMKPEFKTFPIKPVLEQLQVEFTPLADEKDLGIKFINSNLHIKSDRKLLRRVLQNLISNAIKYTKEGNVLVGCRRCKKELKIEIHDTGPGIPAHQFSNIFKEFNRLDSTAKDTRGLGLGLSVVQRITNILNHNIDIKSSLDKGSIFSITLPISKAVEQTQTKSNSGDIFRAQNISGINVLCIDNEIKILEGMDILLTGWNCNVSTASSSVEVVEKLNQCDHTPHIILADYHLEDESGLDAIATVHKTLNQKIPAIIITADHSAQVALKVEQQGIKILRKPLKPAQLRALMVQSIIRSRADKST